MSRLAALATLALALGGCHDKPVYAGVGPWRVNRTKLADASGRCEPTDLADGRKGTWCYGQPGIRLGGQDAAVDLYFLGTEPTAPVIEIQLLFRGCREEQLASWLHTTFGAPYEQRGTRELFRNAAAYLVAELPATAGRCLVRILPRSETAELERLRTEGTAPAP